MLNLSIVSLIIACIYVTVKLMLEHQRDKDASEGHLQPREAYTMMGMLKLIREDRKNRKLEEAEKRAERRIKRDYDQMSAGDIPVQSFSEKD